MEVLIGSFVFILGFGIVIMILNGTLVKLSVKEITTADAVAEEYMETSIISGDTLDLDTVVTRSELDFRVRRTVTVNQTGRAAVTIAIERPKQQELLIELYHEYSTPAE